MLNFIIYLTLIVEGVAGGSVVVDKNKESADAKNLERMMEIISKRAEEIERDRELTESLYEKTLLPPWNIIPNEPMRSLIWRMGGGESYRHRFFGFFTALSVEERNDYIFTYPEPNGWTGYYDLILNRYNKSEKKEKGSD